MIYTGNHWDRILTSEFEAPYFAKLWMFLEEEYCTKTVYPAREDLFTALRLTPPEKVKAVILGQDPYIGENQAHGLAFSVKPGCPLPPSLRNMYKELEADLGSPPAFSGNLTRWAEQGVLLLNTVLTVEAGLSGSHAGKGWETFTNVIIRYLGNQQEPLVFVMWGRSAQKKEKLIVNPAHLVLKAAHPSPLSAFHGFFGSRPYSKINDFLKQNGKAEIDWRLE